jgi:transposase
MMMTTAETAATDTILAIDLGKYKSVACHSPALNEQSFVKFSTSRAELVKLLDKHRPDVVLIEACLLSGWVHDLCAAKGVRCLVANTSSEAWKFKHLKRKTDRDDALRLVEIYRLGKFPMVHVPPKEVREQRGLIEMRQKLVGRRVALQNRIRAILVGQGLPAPRGARAWTVVGLVGIAQYAQPIGDCEPLELWRGRLHLTLTELAHVRELLVQAEKKLDALTKDNEAAQLLQTIPGVGPRTAEAVNAFLPKPELFRTSKSRRAGIGLWRLRAAAVPVNRHRPPRPHHQTRTADVAQAAGRMRLGDAALQHLGPEDVSSSDARRQDTQEAGDRRGGAEIVGALLGHAARRHGLA